MENSGLNKTLSRHETALVFSGREDDVYDVLIVGAGLAGMSAALSLAGAGRKVLVLEGRERAGGRVHTITGEFPYPIDAGAEFTHGKGKLTKKFFKKAGIKLRNNPGKMYKKKAGELVESSGFTSHYREVHKKLNSLERDMGFSEFLSRYFGDEKYDQSRKDLIALVEGFDAADADLMSAFAVRDEWNEDSVRSSAQVEKGYGALADHIYGACYSAGCEFRFSATVKAISWNDEMPSVQLSNGTCFKGRKIIVTVPLGVLQAPLSEQAAILFQPRIPFLDEAVKKIGFGAVVKVVLGFADTFWDDKKFGDRCLQAPQMGFLLSEKPFGAWWTYNRDVPVITAWSGGKAARGLSSLTNENILEAALRSITEIFSADPTFIKSRLKYSLIADWQKDPFSRGAYSYRMPESGEALKLLRQPLNNKLYFAGEALGEDASMATVESALASGMQVAERVLGS